MPRETRAIDFGSVSRFRQLLRASGALEGLSAEEMLELQHSIEQPIAAAAAARGVCLVGAAMKQMRLADRRRRAAARAATKAKCAATRALRRDAADGSVSE